MIIATLLGLSKCLVLVNFEQPDKMWLIVSLWWRGLWHYPSWMPRMEPSFSEIIIPLLNQLKEASWPTVRCWNAKWHLHEDFWLPSFSALVLRFPSGSILCRLRFRRNAFFTVCHTKLCRTVFLVWKYALRRRICWIHTSFTLLIPRLPMCPGTVTLSTDYLRRCVLIILLNISNSISVYFITLFIKWWDNSCI